QPVRAHWKPRRRVEVEVLAHVVRLRPAGGDAARLRALAVDEDDGPAADLEVGGIGEIGIAQVVQVGAKLLDGRVAVPLELVVDSPAKRRLARDVQGGCEAAVACGSRSEEPSCRERGEMW